MSLLHIMNVCFLLLAVADLAFGELPRFMQQTEASRNRLSGDGERTKTTKQRADVPRAVKRVPTLRKKAAEVPLPKENEISSPVPSIAQNGGIDKNCGAIQVSAMRNTVRYTSAGDNKEYAIKIAKDLVAGEGSFGKVLIGYAESLLGGRVRDRCVAVKIGKDGDNDFANGVKVVAYLQSKVAPQDRSHVIQIFDSGTTAKQKREMIVMEMAGQNLLEHFHENVKWQLGEGEILDMAKMMAEPLREFHQVGMHLDLKPENLMFVRDPQDGSEALKLIDFDGAELNERGHSAEADFCVRPKIGIATPMYSPPEFAGTCRPVSTKVDIWALGIMVHRYATLQKCFGFRGATNEHRLLSEKIAEIYSKPVPTGPPTDLMARFRKFDSESGRVALWHMIAVWARYPRVAALLMNVLNVRPEKRMTAQGILDFLGRRCFPASLREGDPQDFNVFAFGDAKQFVRRKEAALREQKLLWEHSGAIGRNLMSKRGGTGSAASLVERQLEGVQREWKQWDEMDKSLDRALQSRRDLLAQEAQKPDCDTKTTKS